MEILNSSSPLRWPSTHVLAQIIYLNFIFITAHYLLSFSVFIQDLTTRFHQYNHNCKIKLTIKTEGFLHELIMCNKTNKCTVQSAKGH